MAIRVGYDMGELCFFCALSAFFLRAEAGSCFDKEIKVSCELTMKSQSLSMLLSLELILFLWILLIPYYHFI